MNTLSKAEYKLLKKAKKFDKILNLISKIINKN